MKQLITIALLLSISFSYGQWNKASILEKNNWQNHFQKAQFDNPDLAIEYEFEITKDPSLNTVPQERRILAMEYTKQLLQNHAAIADVEWTERGPKNVSGRTRAIMFDPNFASNNKVWAAGITGGLWYNLDIQNNGEWINIGSFWDNIAVSTLAFDPTNTTNFYAGTGEGWTSSSVRGAGIWKSSDAGVNWSRLESTNNSDFYNIQKIVITSTGRIIASTNSGLFISNNNGDTWSESIDGFFGDIEITANGTIFASQGYRYNQGTVYRSTDNGDNWTDLNITSSDPTERTELASAPSNPTTIYAVSSVGRNVSWFKKSTDNGDSWTDIEIPMYLDQGCNPSSDDFTRGQAWYDLIMMVNPTDENIVYVGGIDWHKTINGGNSWESVSYWTGSCGEYVHADQHAMVFYPNDNSKALVGCDGGIFAISDMINGFTTDAHLNNNYNVTQFYGCAMENIAGSNYMLAGAQDNGTQKFTNAGFALTTQATGGDGGFCFIDQDDSQIQITSYVYNNWRLSTNGGSSFLYYPSTSNGSFINPGDYDSESNVLYASTTPDSIFISNIPVDGNNGNYVEITNGLEGGRISTIKVSSYSENVIYVGTSSGKIFRLTDAITNPTSSNIDLSGSLPSGRISSIDLGTDENRILVTYSNYGVNSVWQTLDGGATWNSIEYNLPDMPIRGGLYNPNNNNQILLATETGVWSINDISTETEWAPSNSGLANVRCDQLKYRNSDKMVAVATYGRGLFTSDIFADPQPVASFDANTTVTCPIDTVFLFDHSSKNPNQWAWSISPNTFIYLMGTDANSQNPIIQFNAAGNYTIELTATNGAGSGTITKTDYILVNDECHYIMSDETVYACDGKFYDSGYDEVYENSEDYTMTFYPTAGHDYISFDFTTFDVEHEVNCAYDYLSIYDGENTSAPLIGKYCGTVSPGSVSGENNNAGAITFKFHSDGYSGGHGWIADISCTSINIEEANKNKFKIYPNPAKNYINIELDASNQKTIIHIYDITGKLVYESSFIASKRINTTDFNKGMYIVKVINNNSIKQKSIVIE